MGAAQVRGRRALLTVGMTVLALAVGGILVAGDDASPDGVRAAGDPSVSTPAEVAAEPEASTPPPSTMGVVGDIAVEVSPRAALLDGEVLTLTVDGADGLPDDAIVLMCTGEVVDDTTAIAGCDASAVTSLDGAVGPGVAEGGQQVAVSRFLRVSSAGADPNVPGTYDCATEPAGCGLVLAPYRLPPTAVSIPLTFAAVPVAAGEAVVQPDAALADDQVVTVEASGLRPLASHRVSQCGPVDGDAWACDWATISSFTTDEHGDLLGAVRVRSAIYPPQGRVDCTATPCSLVVQPDASSDSTAAVEIGFASGVVAPIPRLELEPPGPYVDGQEVTVQGTGFPPGRDLSGSIAQCPAHLDTRSEERCTYDLAPVVVGDDGTFTTTRTVSASLLFTGSCADTGCVIGWVIPKGATVAAVPIEVTG